MNLWSLFSVYTGRVHTKLVAERLSVTEHNLGNNKKEKTPQKNPKNHKLQKHHQKKPKRKNKDRDQGYLKPEICSIVHKHHQRSNTHVIATPRAAHQPNGCQVMNDVSQKILWRREETKVEPSQCSPEGLCADEVTSHTCHTRRDALAARAQTYAGVPGMDWCCPHVAAPNPVLGQFFSL